MNYTEKEAETIQFVTAECIKDVNNYYEDFFLALQVIREWAMEFEREWETLSPEEQEDRDYILSVEEFSKKKIEELKNQ